MKVYIAAPFQFKSDARARKQELEAAGIVVTSRWIDEETSVGFGTPDENRAFALMDLDDVRAADVLVLLNPPGFEQKGTGGRHVEFGAALAMGMSCVILGLRSNVFHYDELVLAVDYGTPHLADDIRGAYDCANPEYRGD